MRRFRGRPLSTRNIFTRALMLLAFALLCALMGWLVYTQPVEDTQPTASEKTTATSPTGASIGTASDQRPNPQHTPARRYPDIRLPEPTIELTDPVGAGLVNTLPQPGGNVTGFMGAPVGAKEACELEWSQVEFGRSASLHVRRAKKGKPAGRQHAELVAA